MVVVEATVAIRIILSSCRRGSRSSGGRHAAHRADD